DKAEEIISCLRPSFLETEAGIEVINRIEIEKKTAKGSPFIEISGLDLNGKEVYLSEYVGKGKIVYLDFWASWCGPCRRSMPGLVEIYEKYKDKDFEIVGVSLDNNKDSWEKATKEDRITWPQFSNLEGWQEPAAQAYGVNFVPFTILFDKEGHIVDKNLSKDKLATYLEEHLK
ncbi:TlpA family protein disulfide reductase, partial [Bacteroidales bacterium OttesenSCG-928-M11]|nr:TlpA family protein disulfide reductase [Bacteroidales bacterium OttesenSCG-928-M11]